MKGLTQEMACRTDRQARKIQREYGCDPSTQAQVRLVPKGESRKEWRKAQRKRAKEMARRFIAERNSQMPGAYSKDSE